MTIKDQTTKIRQALTSGTYDIDAVLQACDELDLQAGPPTTKLHSKDEALVEDDGPPKKPTPPSKHK